MLIQLILYSDPQFRRSKRKDGLFDKESSDICNLICNILVDAGVNVDAVNEAGQTPLMIALMQV